ncbi:hypothetical protein [Runella limosa]|uniref:hypothetical protein n=1 Tax=Runella limosa TaxID=370978 RepID=UPI00040DD80E|nr:hypothetical protein [Runella limosa]
MKKHWLRFLPEAGRIIQGRAHEIEIKYLKLDRLKKELEEFEREILSLEDDYFEWVHNDWSSEEIEQAKNKAEQQNT